MPALENVYNADEVVAMSADPALNPPVNQPGFQGRPINIQLTFRGGEAVSMESIHATLQTFSPKANKLPARYNAHLILNDSRPGETVYNLAETEALMKDKTLNPLADNEDGELQVTLTVHGDLSANTIIAAFYDDFDIRSDFVVARDNFNFVLYPKA